MQKTYKNVLGALLFIPVIVIIPVVISMLIAQVLWGLAREAIAAVFPSLRKQKRRDSVAAKEWLESCLATEVEKDVPKCGNI